MKQIRQVISYLLALCLLLALVPAARADSGETDEAYFRDHDWDEIVAELLTKYDADEERVALGYCNIVTGEEHYLNGDQYMVSGSMYKVPLNMVFAEKIAQGEMDWDTKVYGVKYETLMKESIVYSNNDYAKILWEYLGNGSYRHYRDVIAPIMGEVPEMADPKYYENNFFTPKQMIYCLRLLAENPDNYPGIIEAMQRAEPNNYFKLHEKRFDIGHKYGFLQTEYHLYLNDCAVCFTDDPIVIVAFTDNILKAYEVLTDYCTLMCDYTQYHTALRLEEEAAAEAARQEEIRLAEEADREAAEAAAQAAAAQMSPVFGAPDPTGRPDTPAAEPATAGTDTLPLILGMVMIAAMLLTVIVLAYLSRKYRRRLVWAVALALLAGALAIFAMFGFSLSSLFPVKPVGDPQQTVTAFFQALDAGDYETACDCLEGAVDLGLGTEPEDELSRRVLAALRDNRSWELYGDCTVEGLTARQQVELRYLDLAALDAAAREELVPVLEALSEERGRDSLYDAGGALLPQAAREAYTLAMEAVLPRASEYTTTTGVQLALAYTNGGWHIIAGQNLLNALAGGISG